MATKIMVIRHAEKPSGMPPPNGVTADGEVDPDSLIIRGWQRAGALISLFDSAGGPLRNGLTVPQKLFASNPQGDVSQRPLQTITPLAAHLGCTIDTRFSKGDEKDLVDAAKNFSRTVLISWQRERIPGIANRILGDTIAPQDWPHDRFDVVWVFDLNQTTGQYVFSQVPQQLLAGDSSVEIAGGVRRQILR
ncbi:MAG TPA: hypothetical protein VGZ00_09875 [Candidatus Baltobacteraceae bacterium]|jgi:hypothetical protein|nr:hypothetical protein [Candidatus Baltobacteraceae bacterium]